MVLVLIAIASAFSIASVDRLVGRVEERRWSDQTLQALAKLRNKAVLGGVVVVAQINFTDGQLASLAAAGQEPAVNLLLPASYQYVPVDLEAPKGAVNAQGSAGAAVAQGTRARDASPATPTQVGDVPLPIYFYPDGTMDDAAFDLVLPTQGRRRFRLARYSGKIERSDVPDVADAARTL